MALAGLLLAIATPVSAGLVGSDVSWQYYAFGGAYAGVETSGSFVANGTVQGQFIDPYNTPFFNIIVADSTVTFDYSPLYPPFQPPWDPSVVSLAPTIWNGIALNFTGATITGLSIDPLTNMSGFVPGDISFTAGQIQVNWANLSFDNSTKVVLDVTSTPEPGSVLLIAVGLTTVGWLRGRSATSPTERERTRAD